MTQPANNRLNVADEVRKSQQALFTADQVIEVRTLGKSGVHSGYFKDTERLVQVVEVLDTDPTIQGIYVVLNELDPSLLARRVNRVERLGRSDVTTGDANIIRRRWLPIDIDPKRAAGISSSDEEHNRSLQKAEAVASWLRDLGFPEPIFGDSGNGAHLLYRIDLPNTDLERDLIRRCLESIAFFHSDETCVIDTSVFNAARIWKLYGTVARKGDSIPERPHRRARLVSVPGVTEPAGREVLEHLASRLPDPDYVTRQQSEQHRTITDSHGGKHQINLREWLAEHDIDVRTEKSWNEGQIFNLEQCPFSDAHRDGAYAIQFSNGNIFVGCHHDSCGGGEQRWPELRERFDSGGQRRQQPSQVPICIKVQNIERDASQVEEIHADWVISAVSSMVPPKGKVDQTYLTTLQLLKEGKSVMEIAELRTLKVGTVAGHCTRLIQLGEQVSIGDIDAYMPHERRQSILKVLKKHGFGELRRCKDSLGAGYSYGDIQIVVAWLVEQNSEHVPKAKPRKRRQYQKTEGGSDNGSAGASSGDISWQKPLRKQTSEIEAAEVSRLLQELNSSSFIGRKWAAQNLGDLGDNRAVEPLIGMLNDENFNLRIVAAEALGKLKDTRAIIPLSTSLTDTHPKVRANALYSLSQIRDPEILQKCSRMLDDISPIVQQTSVVILGELRSPDAIDQLFEYVRRADEQLKELILPILGSTADQRAYGILMQYLQSRNADIVASAAEGLGYLKDERARDAILILCGDARATVCAGALRALGLIGDPNDLEFIARYLHNEYITVRAAAVEALGNIGGSQVLEYVIPALKDEKPSVRRTAVEALGQQGYILALEPLKQMLNDEDRYVRGSAKEAIQAILIRK